MYEEDYKRESKNYKIHKSFRKDLKEFYLQRFDIEEEYFDQYEVYFMILIKTTNKNFKDLELDAKDRQLQVINKTFAYQLTFETMSKFIKIEPMQRLWQHYQKSDHLQGIKSLIPDNKKRMFYSSVRDNDLLQHFD
jgi:hypothetical protein